MSEIPEGYELVYPEIPDAEEEAPQGYEVVAPQGGGIDGALGNIPGFNKLAEVASAANKSVLEIVDFLGPDAVNSILQISGSEARVPRVSELAEEKLGIGATFTEPGLTRDVLRGAGSVIPAAVSMGGLLRGAAQQLSPLARQTESVMSGVLRQAGKTTPTQDVTLGLASGAGSVLGGEVGGDSGALVGAFLAPTAFQAAASPIKSLVQGGANEAVSFIRGFSSSTAGMSDDAASTILGEQLIRSGMSADEVIQKLQRLGPDAIPADVSNNFARLLRVASNKVPRIEARASQTFAQRGEGQEARILNAFDDATGTSTLNADDEIARLNNVLKPQVDALYQQARESGVQMSYKAKKMIVESPSLNLAFRKAQRSLADKQALGERVGDLERIDATKQALDDQIGAAMRKGEKNQAMNLVKLKNALVSDVDNAIPVYKQARDMFAGKAQLEAAVQSGEQYMKLSPREIKDFVSSMGQSELKMFKLGAKRAILDKIDSIQQNADAVKSVFGKKGDLEKLRILFGDEKQFVQFKNALEKEANFVLTRNAAQANSTTVKQLSDIEDAQNAFAIARDAILDPTSGLALFNRIVSGFGSKRGSQEFTRALENAGDVLLESGMNPERLRVLLKNGSAKVLQKELESALKIPQSKGLQNIKSLAISGGEE